MLYKIQIAESESKFATRYASCDRSIIERVYLSIGVGKGWKKRLIVEHDIGFETIHRVHR